MTKSDRCYCVVRHCRHELEGTSEELQYLDQSIRTMSRRLNQLNDQRWNMRPWRSSDDLEDEILLTEVTLRTLTENRENLRAFIASWTEDLRSAQRGLVAAEMEERRAEARARRGDA